MHIPFPCFLLIHSSYCCAAPVKVPDPSAPGRRALDYIEPAKKAVAGAFTPFLFFSIGVAFCCLVLRSLFLSQHLKNLAYADAHFADRLIFFNCDSVAPATAKRLHEFAVL
jgi:hypothetical protein